MRKRMKQRVALFLSFAMAFTSVDSSVLVAASDVTEVASEETHNHEEELSEPVTEESLPGEEVVEDTETPIEGQELDETDSDELISVDEEAVEEEQILGEEPATDVEQETETEIVEETETEIDQSAIISVVVTPIKDTPYITELGDQMVSGSNVLVTYQDGSTFESAIYGDELWDGDGHLLQFYLRNTQDASIRYKAMEYDIPEGTYTLECEVDGTVWDSGATFRSVALSSATLQELGLGSTVIHMDSAHSHNWYQFTAPEDGRYMIRNCKNLWIYKKTEDGRNAVNHCIGSKDNTSVGYFNAKKDVTYFLGFGNYQSDQASDETITIEKIETKAIDHVNSVTIQNL